MTEDDVRRIIREEIDRARYLTPVHIGPAGVPPARHNPYPVQLPMPPYRFQKIDCSGGFAIATPTQ